MEVWSKAQKNDAFEGLLRDLDPDFVIVFANDVSAEEVILELMALILFCNFLHLTCQHCRLFQN